MEHIRGSQADIEKVPSRPRSHGFVSVATTPKLTPRMVLRSLCGVLCLRSRSIRVNKAVTGKIIRVNLTCFNAERLLDALCAGHSSIDRYPGIPGVTIDYPDCLPRHTAQLEPFHDEDGRSRKNQPAYHDHYFDFSDPNLLRNLRTLHAQVEDTQGRPTGSNTLRDNSILEASTTMQSSQVNLSLIQHEISRILSYRHNGNYYQQRCPCLAEYLQLPLDDYISLVVRPSKLQSFSLQHTEGKQRSYSLCMVPRI